MNLDNLSKADREQLFKQQGDNSNSAISQQLLEMKAHLGYGERLESVAATYSASTNKIQFSTPVHYLSVYSDSDVDFVFNAVNDTDASNSLSSPTTHNNVHFIASAERLNFGLPEMPITRIDFKSHSGTAVVYVTGFVKATLFNEDEY